MITSKDKSTIIFSLAMIALGTALFGVGIHIGEYKAFMAAGGVIIAFGVASPCV